MREVKLPLRKESIVCLATVLRSMPCETQYALRNSLVNETLPGTPKGRSCVMTETPKPAAGPFSHGHAQGTFEGPATLQHER